MELVSGGDPEYASRLRYSYLSAFSKHQAPKPDKQSPKSVKEANLYNFTAHSMMT